jgi:hypothetical protein
MRGYALMNVFNVFQHLTRMHACMHACLLTQCIEAKRRAGVPLSAGDKLYPLRQGQTVSVGDKL